MSHLKKLISELESESIIRDSTSDYIVKDTYKEKVLEIVTKINERLESLEESVEYLRNQLHNG